MTMNLLRRIAKFLNPASMPAPNTSQLANEDDIMACYRLLLGRAPDVGGWKTFTNMLGGTSVELLTSAFLTSSEFKNSALYRQSLALDSGVPPVAVDLGTYRQFVLPNDPAVGELVLRDRTYETSITALLRQWLQPGMVFLDIGANIGYFSLLAASIVGEQGKVIAFEANPQNCKLHVLSILANHFNQISLYPLAVAEREKLVVFDQLLGSNGIISAPLEKIGDNEEIARLWGRTLLLTVRIDSIVKELPRLDAIKIDVEGAEYQALCGAEPLIVRHRPKIVSEYSPSGLQAVSNVSGETYLQWFIDHGYHLSAVMPSGELQSFAKNIQSLHSYAQTHGGDHIDIVAQTDE